MNEERKLERKRRRFVARLKDLKGVNVVETPETNIVLCNVGQATGYEKQNIVNLIEEYSLNMEPPKFIAEIGESHSFLTFQTTENAMLFYKVCNGKAPADKSGVPLYMGFVERVPDTEILCPLEDPIGLTILNDFITEDEEKAFLDFFDWTPETESSLKNRQVKHYGYEFRYETNDVDLENPLDEKIPEICSVLWKRLEEKGFQLGVPDQLTVNKYLPGQGIPSHVDRHSPFGGTILSLSLGAAVLMEWRQRARPLVPVAVPERSLMLMQGEARYDWQHGIQPRTHDPVVAVRSVGGVTRRVVTSERAARGARLSLTFRWTRRAPCRCGYAALCDAPAGDLDEEVAADLEELHVHQVYEQIAGHFSSTRHTAWPRVVQFLQSARVGDIVVDLGAGNGKNILHRDDILQVACERSAGLVAECAARARAPRARAGCVRLDMLRAPLRARSADRVMCIAVVHHFTTERRRLLALSTIHSLLRPAGLALVTVWARDQRRSRYLAKRRQAPENERTTVAGVTLPIHENRTEFQHRDLLVPWKLRRQGDAAPGSPAGSPAGSQAATSLLRYYHVFEQGELPALCARAGLLVRDEFYEEGNWCVVCERL